MKSGREQGDEQMGNEELAMRNNPFDQFCFINRAICKTPAERLKFVVGECMIRRIDREIQQMGIPNTVKTAALGNKLAMQRYYFIKLPVNHQENMVNQNRK
jgi:hypothetical protein